MKRKLEKNQTVILFGKVAQGVSEKERLAGINVFFSKQNHLDFTNRML